MHHLHNLLVATDLSAPSRHLALRATLLAKTSRAKLTFLHVLEASLLDELQRVIGNDGVALRQRIREQAADDLSQLVVEAGEALQVTASTRIVEGVVLEATLAEADSVDASLIMIGVRGAGFMRHWLVGATAERLLRKSLRPILVVKQPPYGDYHSVLVAVDFSPWSQHAIGMAQALAPNAKLLLLHAYEVPYEGKLRYAGVDESVVRQYREAAHKDALQRLQQCARDAGLAQADWRPVVIHGDAAQRVLEQEEVQGVDLVVLGKHGAGMIEELLLGSVTKHVLAHARSDVLVATV